MKEREPVKDQNGTDWVGEIRTVFSEQMFIAVESADMNLLEAGIIDSMLIVELLANIEQRFGVTVPMTELDIQDFSSVAAIANLLRSYNLKPSSGTEPRHSYPG